MADREYLITYSEDARKRHYHSISKGKVIKFMVQLEVKYEGNWKQVIRYDCAHGYAHQDSYDLHGNYKKEEMSLSFEEAMTLADDDIDENWENYKNRFSEGYLP